MLSDSLAAYAGGPFGRAMRKLREKERARAEAAAPPRPQGAVRHQVHVSTISRFDGSVIGYDAFCFCGWRSGVVPERTTAERAAEGHRP